jgi:Holliday junction resolvase RusA-like endonuclease
MTPLVSFSVPGLPETKGSWRALPGGRVKADNPREKAWASAVGWSARIAMRALEPVPGPVLVRAVFTLPPPIGKWNRRDADKLARSLLDAITGIVVVDDDQVAELHVVKRVRPSGLGAQVDILTIGAP